MTKLIFEVQMHRHWFKWYPCIVAKGLLYCIIPSRDMTLAEKLCEYLNRGMDRWNGQI